MLTTKEGYSKASVWLERVVATLIGLFFLGLIISFCVLASRDLSEESKEIVNTFKSFDNKDGVRYSQAGTIVFPDKTISLYDLEYNGNRCELITCRQDVFYAYAQQKTDKNHRTFYLLAVNYDDNDINLIDTVENVYCRDLGSWRGFCVGNKLYFAPHDDEYITYDLEEKSFGFAPAVDANNNTIYESYFSNYSYEILENQHFFTDSTRYGIEIKDKTTAETRTLTMESLSAFSEGEYILSLEPSCTRTFFRQALEKDGDIYILGRIDLDSYMYSQCVVMKYDFTQNKLTYYSSDLYNWDEPPTDFYIN